MTDNSNRASLVEWIPESIGVGAIPTGVGAVHWWCWGQTKFEQCRAGVIAAVDVEIGAGMLQASQRSAEIAKRTEYHCNSLCGPDPNTTPATKVYKISELAKPFIGYNAAEIAALEQCANTGSNCAGWTAKEARDQIDYWNSIPAQKQSIINEIKNDQGCDATKKGRLAAALRQALQEKKGTPSTSYNDAAFTSAEMKEWLELFGGPPSPADIGVPTKKEAGSVTTITASEICPSGWTLPPAATGGGPVVPPVEPPVEPPISAPTTAKKKTPWGLILGLGAAGVAAAWYVQEEKKKRGAR